MSGEFNCYEANTVSETGMTQIGPDRQLFVDDIWIDESIGVSRLVQHPVRRDAALALRFKTPIGRPLPGFALDDSPEWFDDEIEGVMRRRRGTDMSGIAGKPVRLRFALKDADLYAFRFR